MAEIVKAKEKKELNLYQEKEKKEKKSKKVPGHGGCRKYGADCIPICISSNRGV